MDMIKYFKEIKEILEKTIARLSDEEIRLIREKYNVKK